MIGAYSVHLVQRGEEESSRMCLLMFIYNFDWRKISVVLLLLLSIKYKLKLSVENKVEEMEVSTKEVNVMKLSFQKVIKL